jgi:enediyne biosynthesis protein E4
MKHRRRVVVVVAATCLLLALGGGAARLWAMRRLRTELDAATAEMDGGLYSLARKRLAVLAREWPSDPQVCFLLARCEAARGNPAEAVKLWASLPEDSPWAASAALEWASAAFGLGRISEAERVLKTALGRPSPQFPGLVHLAVVALGQEGRIDEAPRLLESLWDQRASLPIDDFANRLGMLGELISLDVMPFPLEYYVRRLEEVSGSLGDDDARILKLAQARLAIQNGDFESALSKLASVLTNRNDDRHAWKLSLECAVAAGQPEQARGALEHVPVGVKSEGEIVWLRAWLALQRGDSAAELSLLDNLLQIEPGRSAAVERLAELKQQAGDHEGAAVLRARKTELDEARDRYNRIYKLSQLDERLSEMAVLAERLGRWFEARAFWELSQLKDPSNPDAARAVARLRARQCHGGSAATGTLAEVLASDLALDTIAPALRSSVPGGASERIPQFEDAGPSSGLASFVFDNGTSEIHQLPEMASGGVGLIDFDGDGLYDVYCVQGGHFPPPATPGPMGDRLFRNRGDGTFEDVTAQSKIGSFSGGYGHGVSVGDYDNDSRPDLFVTRWRSYALYRNRGDGTFEDVTQAAGLGGDRDWPTSSAFADLDNDGDLDLYVCHYGRWDAEHPVICKDPAGRKVVSCDPLRVESLPDHVFRNDSGRLVDVTAQAGLVDRDGRGLGVVVADLDCDGKVDVFVANDSTANFLFHNLGGFRFEEIGHATGVAANAGGGYQAGMGVACGDLNGDGLPDLAVTNFYGESTTFFRNLGQGLFADHSTEIGLLAPSRFVLGFGAAFFDANNDGCLDLMTANGHVTDLSPVQPYAMKPQLYLARESGRLNEVTAQAGAPFEERYVGRGLAIGDLDNDGLLDAVMVAHNGPIVYFHQTVGLKPDLREDVRLKPDLREKARRGQWVMFRLEGTKSNREGVGALVTISQGGRTQIRQRLGGGSYQSASDPRIHFGLGSPNRLESVEVRWPSGRVDRHRDVAAGRLYVVREGDAKLKIISRGSP